MSPSTHAGLEVIVGSMFSGKSEELIRRVKRAVIARRTVQVFKPSIDDRFGVEVVRSHDGDSFVARPVRSSDEILSLLSKDTTVVGIDEVQFFDAGVIGVVRSLVADGRRVICAGLDLDFRGEPFGPVPTLLALAERVDKLEAICVVCGEPATRTQRIVNSVPAFYDEPIIVIGAKEAYEARCRTCHEVPRRAAAPA
jgi:thymidine kinase